MQANARQSINHPDELKELEKKSAYFMIRLLEQQELESEVLSRPESLEQLTRGLANHEILSMHEVNMSL